MKSLIQNEILQSIETLKNSLENELLIDTIAKVVNICTDALNNKNKILLIGNGGSAADAQHIAGEFVSRFNFDRAPLPAIALTTDTSIMTAIGNDYGFEHLFARQIQALASPGDILFAYSTSGNSTNILQAIKVAKSSKMKVVGFTGANQGKMDILCDFLINIPSTSTPKIQENHAVVGHIICGLVEQNIFKK